MNTGLLVEVWCKGFLWDRFLGYYYVPLTEVSYMNEVTSKQSYNAPTTPGQQEQQQQQQQHISPDSMPDTNSNTQLPDITNTEGSAQWVSLDSELEMRGAEIIGTKKPTGHSLLIDCRLDLPFDPENTEAADLQRKLGMLNNMMDQEARAEQARRQILYNISHSGYSEDSDYTSDLNYPVGGQGANSSASQFRTAANQLATPQRSLETSRENSYERDDHQIPATGGGRLAPSNYMRCIGLGNSPRYDEPYPEEGPPQRYSQSQHASESSEPLFYNSRPRHYKEYRRRKHTWDYEDSQDGWYSEGYDYHGTTRVDETRIYSDTEFYPSTTTSSSRRRERTHRRPSLERQMTLYDDHSYYTDGYSSDGRVGKMSATYPECQTDIRYNEYYDSITGYTYQDERYGQDDEDRQWDSGGKWCLGTSTYYENKRNRKTLPQRPASSIGIHRPDYRPTVTRQRSYESDEVNYSSHSRRRKPLQPQQRPPSRQEGTGKKLPPTPTTPSNVIISRKLASLPATPSRQLPKTRTSSEESYYKSDYNEDYNYAYRSQDNLPQETYIDSVYTEPSSYGQVHATIKKQYSEDSQYGSSYRAQVDDQYGHSYQEPPTQDTYDQTYTQNAYKDEYQTPYVQPNTQVYPDTYQDTTYPNTSQPNDQYTSQPNDRYAKPGIHDNYPAMGYEQNNGQYQDPKKSRTYKEETYKESYDDYGVSVPSSVYDQNNVTNTYNQYQPETYDSQYINTSTGYQKTYPDTYNQETYNTEDYSQDSYNQDTYNQGTYNQETYSQDAYNVDTYKQQDTYGQQGTYNQPDVYKDTYNQQDVYKDTYNQGDTYKDTYKDTYNQQDTYKDTYKDTYNQQDTYKDAYNQQDTYKETYNQQDRYKETYNQQDTYKDTYNRQDEYKDTYNQQESYKDTYNKQDSYEQPDVYKDTYSEQDSYKDTYNQEEVYKDTYNQQDVYKDTYKQQDVYKDTYTQQDVYKDSYNQQDVYKDTYNQQDTYNQEDAYKQVPVTSQSSYEETYDKGKDYVDYETPYSKEESVSTTYKNDYQEPYQDYQYEDSYHGSYQGSFEERYKESPVASTERRSSEVPELSVTTPRGQTRTNGYQSGESDYYYSSQESHDVSSIGLTRRKKLTKQDPSPLLQQHTDSLESRDDELKDTIETTASSIGSIQQKKGISDYSTPTDSTPAASVLIESPPTSVVQPMTTMMNHVTPNHITSMTVTAMVHTPTMANGKRLTRTDSYHEEVIEDEEYPEIIPKEPQRKDSQLSHQSQLSQHSQHSQHSQKPKLTRGDSYASDHFPDESYSRRGSYVQPTRKDSFSSTTQEPPFKPPLTRTDSYQKRGSYGQNFTTPQPISRAESYQRGYFKDQESIEEPEVSLSNAVNDDYKIRDDSLERYEREEEAMLRGSREDSLVDTYKTTPPMSHTDSPRGSITKQASLEESVQMDTPPRSPPEPPADEELLEMVGAVPVPTQLKERPEMTSKQRWHWAYNQIVMQLRFSLPCASNSTPGSQLITTIMLLQCLEQFRPAGVEQLGRLRMGYDGIRDVLLNMVMIGDNENV
ncbi:PREDICTED: uncharacterized protein LOC107188226 [Dufourea novaeangliae]|uniref:uncharacterized protein LOC107188226 n=1 Tax=Dufourea novaeangliae TaxID=178035 RepID=UPI000767077E|nr:PREDICTED: uncharacterized protein LOC107188226 [Dufourea novaeangliae]